MKTGPWDPRRGPKYITQWLFASEKKEDDGRYIDQEAGTTPNSSVAWWVIFQASSPLALSLLASG